MAFGTVYNNNQGNKANNDPGVTVYSNYRMNNAESTIDPSCITFRFWKSSLCVSIYPKKQTGNDEVSFDMDNGITIYLSHVKARILKNEIEKFLSDPVTYGSVGVPSGQAIITISNGAEFGKNVPVICIRKVSEDGTVAASFAYECKTDYYSSIRNYNDSKKTFDQVFEDYKNIELEQFITVLDEYVKASTNAVAFSLMDQRRFSYDRMDRKIDSIAAALGVDTAKSYANGGGQKKSSFFNQSNSNGGSTGTNYSSGVSYGTATIDDLE